MTDSRGIRRSGAEGRVDLVGRDAHSVAAGPRSTHWRSDSRHRDGGTGPPGCEPGDRRAARVDEAWIAKRTGTSERPWAEPGERLSDFAARAARDALARAGVDPAELDLVLVATSTADEITPNAAPLVAGMVGADRAGALDVGSACTGWLAALALACGQIESGRATHALVVGADFLSRFLDFSDRETAPLFADGAGAAVVSSTGERPGRIGPIVLHADHAGADLIRLARGERIQMRGQETFRAAVGRLSEVTGEALEGGGLRHRRDRPIRLSPGELADHPRRRPAARAQRRPRRRLRRSIRECVDRDAADRALGRGVRGPPAPRRSGPARRVRGRLYLGRHHAPVGVALVVSAVNTSHREGSRADAWGGRRRRRAAALREPTRTMPGAARGRSNANGFMAGST